MKLLYIAVILIVMQTLPPVPRKAADSASSAGKSIQQNATDDQTPATKPTPTINPVTPKPEQNPSTTPSSKDTEQSVRVRELPAMSIHRDWADWVLWGFNGLLVIAGFLGIRVAYKTLKTIERQARSTHHQAVQVRKQTQIFTKSAEAALLTAQAVITENRPWLLIPPGPNEIGIQEPFLEAVEVNMGNRMAHCIFFTKNYGNTPGQIFASKAELQIGDSPAIPPDPSVYDMNKAEHTVITFPPGESVASEALLAPLAFIKAQDRDEVLHGGKYLWLCGFLKYRDTFERENAPEHETRFCYLYENRFNTPKPFWKISGPSEYTRAS